MREPIHKNDLVSGRVYLIEGTGNDRWVYDGFSTFWNLRFFPEGKPKEVKVFDKTTKVYEP